MIIFNFVFLDLDGNYSEGQIQGLTSASLLRSESFHTNHLKDINNNNNHNNNNNNHNNNNNNNNSKNNNNNSINNNINNNVS